MQDSWKRIIAWCEIYAPQIIEGLNPGATAEEIHYTENYLGVTFPNDLRKLYTLCNGQSNADAPSLLYGEEFLSLERIQQEWRVWKDLLDANEFEGTTSVPAPGIRNDWWCPAWIPLTYDGAGNHYCIDLSPAEGGTLGQIIRMWHDDDERSLEALSLQEWLTKFADAIESGDYVYSPEEYAGIVPREDISEDEEWRGIDKER